MKCEYCGSYLPVFPEGGTCPNCGATLPEPVKPNFPEPPLGRYEDAAGYLELGVDSVSFCRKQYLKAQRLTIPYSELYAVVYQPGVRWKSGYLSLRQWSDRHLPLPVRPEDAVMDRTSVYFRCEKNDLFFGVYQYLEQCAGIARTAKCYFEEQTIWGRYQGTYGYMELQPNKVTFYKAVWLDMPTARTIDFNQIAEVAFCKAEPMRNGGLSVRTWEESKSAVELLDNAILDKTSIDFNPSFNDRMQQIYLLLSEVAQKNILHRRKEK